MTQAMNKNTLCVYDGPSLIDGSRVIVLLTGIDKPSINTKTGDMIQSYIIRADVAPDIAAKEGLDEAICGSCKLRPMLVKLSGKTGDVPCYVDKVRGPAGAYKSWAIGRVEYVTPAQASELISKLRQCLCGAPCKRKNGEYKCGLDHEHINSHSRKTCPNPGGSLGTRDGAYGDPAAVPLEVWQDIHITGRKRTSYTHRWETSPLLNSVAMASIDSQTFPDIDDAIKRAKLMGFRWYRVLRNGESKRDDEIMCPEANPDTDVQCANCGLCNGVGTAKTGRTQKLIGVAIPAIT